jgi:GH15 family glucan-1,4-alpha-glucosidase
MESFWCVAAIWLSGISGANRERGTQDSVYIYNKFSPISYDLWCYIRKIVDFVADNWHLKDHGIVALALGEPSSGLVTNTSVRTGMWEVRGEKQHFVYSKVMMWVCLDRGVRLADKYSKSALNKDKWQRSRDQLFEVRTS